MTALELGDLPKNSLSYSSYSMYLRCPKQYAYRYLEGLKEPPSGNLIFGRGTHKGLEEGFREHIKTDKAPALKLVQEAAVTALEEEVKAVAASEIEWKEGDNLPKQKDDCARLLGVYDPVRILVRPKATEESFQINLKNVEWSINGRIDLSTKDEKIIDFKTAARTPQPDIAEKSEQLTLYQIASPQIQELEIHSLIRKSKPETVVFKSHSRSAHQIQELLTNMSTVAGLIKTGYFPKAQEGVFGSPCGFCGFYERCRGRKRNGTS